MIKFTLRLPDGKGINEKTLVNGEPIKKEKDLARFIHCLYLDSKKVRSYLEINNNLDEIIDLMGIEYKLTIDNRAIDIPTFYRFYLNTKPLFV